jgi:hypothetical protein
VQVATAGYAADCSGLDDLGSKAGVRIPGHASGHTVIGAGHLQFYSAPDRSCMLQGVFILTGQTVDAYHVYRDFTSVTYYNFKRGTQSIGWVESARLKPNGRGIGPRQ